MGKAGSYSSMIPFAKVNSFVPANLFISKPDHLYALMKYICTEKIYFCWLLVSFYSAYV